MIRCYLFCFFCYLFSYHSQAFLYLYFYLQGVQFLSIVFYFQQVIFHTHIQIIFMLVKKILAI